MTTGRPGNCRRARIDIAGSSNICRPRFGKSIPVAQARLLHQALVEAGKSSVLHVYPDADHLFNFALGPDARFHPEAARLSWQRTLDFLAQNLK